MASPLITPIRIPSLPDTAALPGKGTSGNVFGQIFQEAVGTTERMGAGVAEKIGRFLAGEGEELHDVVMQAQKAQLAFELFTQVRNKVVEAYQEVMRTQI